MLILGIETSCDETAAAVVRDDGTVLSDVVHSQVPEHRPYGGVVPELASRNHLLRVVPVIETALSRAALRFEQIAGVAVTCRPGLSGALWVGVQAARGLAWALEKPVVGVDHLMGHILAAFLRYSDQPSEPPVFPFVALLVSGGHTALYRVDGPDVTQMRELGATRDDAAGEAYDKVAKLLGLSYPGGPIIDKLAARGNPNAIELGWPMRSKHSLEFSFSGLKTNVLAWLSKNGEPQSQDQLYDLCAAFQERVVQTLVTKTLKAAELEQVQTIVVGGGVAANSSLRRTLVAAATQVGMRVVIPPFAACTDNAAMIAYAGRDRLARGENDLPSLSINPSSMLPQQTRKGRGAR